jgi:hypothetical protein
MTRSVGTGRRSRPAGYRGCMPPRPARRPLGLFDNPVGDFTLEELTETVKRTRRAADLVAEAIRLARAREPRAEITGSRWQASTPGGPGLGAAADAGDKASWPGIIEAHVRRLGAGVRHARGRREPERRRG